MLILIIGVVVVLLGLFEVSFYTNFFEKCRQNIICASWILRLELGTRKVVFGLILIFEKNVYMRLSPVASLYEL